MRSVFPTLFLICSLLSISCSLQSTEKYEGKEPADEIKESTEVYSVAINEAFSKALVETIYISTKTSTVEGNETGLYEGHFEEQISRMNEIFAPADKEVLRSFLSKHQKSFEINPETALTLNKKYIFLDGAQIEEEFKKPDNESSRLPGSILLLSRVGFNTTYDKAFCNLKYVACPLCGFGTSYLLEKKSGNWQIRESFVHWKS